ncbi:hypothetical protein GCM10010873_14120 [Cypionkella aquatica]|uniref:Uncharacterized protein n=1 Tax=Cypionkella aquatica TaxID=1756042 RepID=A0AA37TVB6_9RHOB|nr:hypothetical protein [Cypionkella aquatica]GLS86438.1 hypothetical protein GCM10010873_14120 [Cypionkella aquatica]
MAQPPRRFQPVPGITVDLAGSTLSITGRAEIWGPQANALRATQIQNTINNAWTMRVGAVDFSCNIIVSHRTSSEPGRALQIEVLDMPGPSNVQMRAEGHPMQLNNREPDAYNWTAAHEFGHVLGLNDRYSESAASRASGDKGGPRHTPANPGYETNMMAVTGGTLSLQNALDLANETQPSEWGLDDDDEVRNWVNNHTAQQIQALSADVRLRGLEILMNGWVSGDDLRAMERLIGGVTNAIEARNIRTRIDPVRLTDLGQRTRLRVAMERMPR